METGEKFNLEKAVKMTFDVDELATAMRKNAIWTVGSWGAHDWKNFENKCLTFNVEGMKFTGLVNIVLAWNDTFTIYFTGLDDAIEKVEREVYIDELIQRIDSIVET